MNDTNNNEQAASLGGRLLASVGNLLGLGGRRGDNRKRKADEDDDANSHEEWHHRVVLPRHHDRQPIVPSGYCAICLETVIDPQDRVGALAGCGHCFHVHCYRQWERFVPQPPIIQCPLCYENGRLFQSIVLFPADSDVQFYDATDYQSVGSVIVRLVETIRYSSDPDLVNKALEELIDLAFLDRKTRIPICMAGGIVGILRCMQVFLRTVQIQKNACQLLGNLALSDSPTERIEMAIVQAGGIQAILSVMKEYLNDTEIQELSCFSLGKVICEATMDVHGQIQALLAAMQKHPDAALLQTYACYALSNLSARNEHDKVVRRIANQGGIEASVKAIQIHWEDEDVVDAAFSVLMALANDNPEICRVIVSSKGIAPIVKAMKKHIDNPEVQESAIVILLNIVRSVGDETNVNVIANAGGVEAILQAMSEHGGDDELQRHGVEILLHLTKIERIRSMLQSSGVEVIRASMELHSNYQQLVEGGQSILDRVKEGDQ